jgi:hypothetical protein
MRSRILKTLPAAKMDAAFKGRLTRIVHPWMPAFPSPLPLKGIEGVTQVSDLPCGCRDTFFEAPAADVLTPDVPLHLDPPYALR